jgi:hypothetical protein
MRVTKKAMREKVRRYACNAVLRTGQAERRRSKWREQIRCDRPNGHTDNHVAHTARGTFEWWNPPQRETVTT